MDKEKMIDLISNKVKLVRTEQDYTQDKMAELLGISKKTLVQIEKGRTSAGWTNAVAVCSLFRNSEILQAALGDDPLEVITTIAHEAVVSPKEKTMGGKIWWKEIGKKGHYRLQQNLISQHYRILDDQDYRWYSSVDKEEALNHLNELNNSN
ncbi:helix-turn-helix domain-containing protein [Paenibacillus sp. sptzw28]|uniref:helix-turn-helix transcriptional regulator n=1 Tax=Paenibacillus sp. sptzw28 TaxID=715179 RepID=UPI001C6E6C1A|nr:helix-turn-helix domain-containing protein [Paenibacillus sp. sptzw28]QYR23871.1 helix-turn-helix domain-containing protein [Paenibacillus sp. sptzw28]